MPANGARPSSRQHYWIQVLVAGPAVGFHSTGAAEHEHRPGQTEVWATQAG